MEEFSFRYHPHPLETGAFQKAEPPEVCQCCGKETGIVYSSPFYAIHNIRALCPACIASGAAAEKFHGQFQDDMSVDAVSDPAKLDELIHRTPGYCGWQQEYWRAHCDDFCAYLGPVSGQGLREQGLLEEVLEDPLWDEWQRQSIAESTDDSSMQCYLFQCLRCGKHLLWFDYD